MRVNRRLPSTLLVLAALTAAPVTTMLPTVAWAQQPSEQDIAQARQLGQQAQAAYDAGNFAESEKLWAAARNLYPVAPTLSLGLARTQTKLGKVVAAQENYNKIIREWGSSPSPPPAFAAAVEAAKAEVGAVSARVANVVISVEGATAPTVTIDGQTVPVAALGLKRPVDPGTHTVHAEAQGYKPAETTFQVAEGGNAEAKLTMEKAPESAVAAAPSTPPGDTTPGQSPPDAAVDTGGKGSNKTLAIVALGVGGAGLVAGTITGLIAMGKKSDLDGKCTNGVCGPELQSDVDSYGTMGTISTIGFIVGVVGVGAGVVLWLTAPKNSAAAKGPRFATVPTATKRSSLEVSPYVGLGAAGVTGTF